MARGSHAALTEDGEARIGEVVYATVSEAVAAAVSGDIIEIIRDIALRQTITIEGKDITITDDGQARKIWDENRGVTLIRVAEDASLTLDGSGLALRGSYTKSVDSTTVAIVDGVLRIKEAVIEGGTLNYGKNAAVSVRQGGRLDMSGGVIEDTLAVGSYSAAVVIGEGAHFEMSGGTIRNNRNLNNETFGSGGVFLAARDSLLSTMNMSGGLITGNEASNGGGIFLAGSSKLYMSGGSVESNKARNYGGGICVSGLSNTSDGNKVNEFFFDGGSISYNNAGKSGGGVYVNSDGAYLRAGYMEGNHASNMGGAVYLSVTPRVLHVSKAVITDNYAGSAGGGLWACPTGNMHLRITDGVAVYGNRAAQVGDDVVNTNNTGFSFNRTTLTIPDRMLGGGAVAWHRDGGYRAGYSDFGIVNPDVERFDPERPYYIVHLEQTPGSHALKAVTSDEAIALANEEATLFIRSNSAYRGGGIGTNGDLELCRMDYRDWSLVAEKVWEDIEDTEDKVVTVFLKIGDRILDSVTLSRENDWRAVFTQLPDPRTLKDKEITVVEGEIGYAEDGSESFTETSSYLVRYDRMVNDEDASIYVRVINSPLPPETTTVEPDPPTEPEEPVKEVLGDYEEPEKAIKTASVKKSAYVETGDSAEIIYYSFLMAAALAGIGYIIAGRRAAQ